MNLAGYAKRAIFALIACVLLVFVFGAIVNAFIPGTFSASQIRLIDILIYIVGFCYVVFGESWF
jgi:hypothetical protein